MGYLKNPNIKGYKYIFDLLLCINESVEIIGISDILISDFFQMAEDTAQVYW